MNCECNTYCVAPRFRFRLPLLRLHTIEHDHICLCLTYKTNNICSIYSFLVCVWIFILAPICLAKHQSTKYTSTTFYNRYANPCGARHRRTKKKTRMKAKKNGFFVVLLCSHESQLACTKSNCDILMNMQIFILCSNDNLEWNKFIYGRFEMVKFKNWLVSFLTATERVY